MTLSKRYDGIPTPSSEIAKTVRSMTAGSRLAIPLIAAVLLPAASAFVRQGFHQPSPTANIAHGRRLRSFLHLNLTPSFQEVFLSEACDDISERIASRLVLPIAVPRPVVSAATRLIVRAMATELSPDLVERVSVAVALASSAFQEEATGGEAQEAASAELEGLAAEVAEELGDSVSLPVLDEGQEVAVLRAVSGAALLMLASPDEILVRPKAFVDLTVETAQELLGGASGRTRLARALNARVDLPFLDEEAEQRLLERALEDCADRLSEMLPSALIDVLRGEATEGLEEAKQYVTDTINDRIDVAGLSEDQEGWIIRNVVDIVVDLVLGDTETELLIMDELEKRVALLERRDALRWRMERDRRRFDAEQAAMEAQIKRIEDRLQS